MTDTQSTPAEDAYNRVEEALQRLIAVEPERGGALKPDGQFHYPVPERVFKLASDALAALPRLKPQPAAGEEPTGYLYAYRQTIEQAGVDKHHIAFSERPDATFSNAVLLGRVQILPLPDPLEGEKP